MTGFDLLGRANCLAIGNARLATVHRNLELSLNAVADDFEVKLTHALDQDLTGVLVGLRDEAGIFPRELAERFGETIALLAEFGLDR